MFYYSMHTCPPCREFTPLLASLYEEENEDEKKFEVVFFSGDGKEDHYKEYYAEMPWPALPWKDPKIKQVAKEFKVKGLPQLIVMKRDGFVLHNNAVEKLTKEGPVAIEEFIDA